MQSTASTWFCTTCGAANDVGRTVCFSCHQARAEHPHTQPAGSSALLHGRYRLIAQVGVGGFGEVYKAVDTRRADHAVAIKQINLRGLTPQKMIEASASHYPTNNPPRSIFLPDDVCFMIDFHRRPCISALGGIDCSQSLDCTVAKLRCIIDIHVLVPGL